MRAFVFLLTIWTSAANAAIRLSPEQPLVNPHPGASRSNPRPFAVATDGSNFLVMWIDNGLLKATIVSEDGKIPHLPSPSQQVLWAYPQDFNGISAVWTGSVYLVTWTAAILGQSTMLAATFLGDGTVLRQPYIVTRTAATISGAMRRAGGRSLQIYLRPDIMQLRGALFDDDGAIIATDVSLPSVTVDRAYTDLLQLASDGEEFALVWRTAEFVAIGAMSTPPPLQQRFDTFHLQRIAADGAAVGASITIGRVEASQSFGAAAGGGKYAIVTTEQQLITPGVTRPMIARFVVDARGGTVSALPKIPSQGGDGVIWNGAAFVAYGISYAPPAPSTIMTLAFSGEPESVAPKPVTVPTANPAASLLLASNGKNVFGTWAESTGSTMAVFGALFDLSAASSNEQPFLVSISWSRQFNPAIAASETESLLVWVDETGGYPAGGLMGLRIAPNGAPIDPAPILIAAATIDGRPVVTFTGNTFLVFWRERVDDSGTGEIVMRRVSRDGSLGPRVALGSGWSAAGASNSAMTLVVITRSPSDIVGYRFTPDGQKLDDQPIVIGSGWGPSVATNGADFFVAWSVGSDYFQYPTLDYIDLFGARVAASGSVDAAPLPIATGSANQLLRGVGSDGRDYLVFYALFADGWGLAVKRVLREGQLDGVTATEPGTIVFERAALLGALSAFAIARDPKGFWLAWQTDEYPNARVVLVHTDVNGHADESMTVADYTGWEPIARVALAETPRGSLQIAYARQVTEGPYRGTISLFLRFAGESAGRWRAAGHH
jgi:hypothetical protein